MKIPHSFFAFALGCIAGELLFSLLLPAGCDRKKELSVACADSVVVTRTDTLRIVQPVTVHEEVVRYVTVTVPDSSNVGKIGKDSIAAPTADHFIDAEKMVMLPITQKVYRDTSYTAWVSGYAAALDSIHIHRPTLPPLELRPARRHRPHAQRRATLRRGRFFNQIIRMNPLKTRQITYLLQKIVVPL